MNRTLIVTLLVLLALGGLFFALRPGPAGTSGPADGPRERVFTLSIKEGAMNPGEIEVREGDQVTLRMTSDEPAEVHLHGYDLEEEVSPGEATTLSFEADLPGRFEIEEHESEDVLGVFLVQPR
ncbi:MAG: cupredoxin domain-containing protein [Actinomycetota bacterium]|nr:cupredoxin domain-containing protein [Actinomycetota bacterium]